jgi:hypothetical protein
VHQAVNSTNTDAEIERRIAEGIKQSIENSEKDLELAMLRKANTEVERKAVVRYPMTTADISRIEDESDKDNEIARLLKIVADAGEAQRRADMVKYPMHKTDIDQMIKQMVQAEQSKARGSDVAEGGPKSKANAKNAKKHNVKKGRPTKEMARRKLAEEEEGRKKAQENLNISPRPTPEEAPVQEIPSTMKSALSAIHMALLRAVCKKESAVVSRKEAAAKREETKKKADNINNNNSAATAPAVNTVSPMHHQLPDQLPDGRGDTDGDEETEGTRTPHTGSEEDDDSDSEDEDEDGDDGDGETIMLMAEQARVETDRITAAAMAESHAFWTTGSKKPKTPRGKWYAQNNPPIDFNWVSTTHNE